MMVNNTYIRKMVRMEQSMIEVAPGEFVNMDSAVKFGLKRAARTETVQISEAAA